MSFIKVLKEAIAEPEEVEPKEFNLLEVGQSILAKAEQVSQEEDEYTAIAEMDAHMDAVEKVLEAAIEDTFNEETSVFKSTCDEDLSVEDDDSSETTSDGEVAKELDKDFDEVEDLAPQRQVIKTLDDVTPSSERVSKARQNTHMTPEQIEARLESAVVKISGESGRD